MIVLQQSFCTNVKVDIITHLLFSWLWLQIIHVFIPVNYCAFLMLHFLLLQK
jgi:hypothetical protein